MNVNKTQIIAIIILSLLSATFIYLYFSQKQITYDPLQNPNIIKVLQKDSIERAQMNKTIDSIKPLFNTTKINIDSITSAVGRKMTIGLNALFVKWKNEKERISKINEQQLEEELNQIIDEQSN